MISHRWTANGATFDLTGTPGTDPSMSVQMEALGVEGMGNPKTDSFTSETPLLDGQTNTGWRAKPRDVFWPIIINSDATNWDLAQQIWWSTLRPNLFGVWRVTKGSTYRELTCRYVDSDEVYDLDPSWQGIEIHGITLAADDPWWKGPAVSATFQTAETPLPFYAVTTDRVFNLMSANTVTNASITNPGDSAAWPVFRLDGPLTAFQIAQYALGGGVGAQISSSTITLASVDYLIIDTNPTVQTATKYLSGGGSSVVTDQLQVSTFFTVPPSGGSQAFYVVLNGTGSLTVTIVPRYFRAF